MTDATNLIRLIIKPTEIYNSRSKSCGCEFETPEYTANADALGTLRLLEGIRLLGFENNIKFYQASSELYGKVQHKIQNEKTPFYPRSPYGVAKLYSYWITKTTGRPTRCSHQMEFFLIMKVQLEVKHLYQEKLLELLLE